MGNRTIPRVSMLCDACGRLSPLVVSVRGPDMTTLRCKWCAVDLATLTVDATPAELEVIEAQMAHGKLVNDGAPEAEIACAWLRYRSAVALENMGRDPDRFAKAIVDERNARPGMEFPLSWEQHSPGVQQRYRDIAAAIVAVRDAEMGR